MCPQPRPGKRKNICGKNIRELRKNFGGRGISLTQDELAARVQIAGGDLGRLTINRIENGARKVTDYELVQLAAALNVDLHRLLCGGMSVRDFSKMIAAEPEEDLPEDVFFAAEDS